MRPKMNVLLKKTGGKQTLAEKVRKWITDACTSNGICLILAIKSWSETVILKSAGSYLYLGSDGKRKNMELMSFCGMACEIWRDMGMTWVFKCFLNSGGCFLAAPELSQSNPTLVHRNQDLVEGSWPHWGDCSKPDPKGSMKTEISPCSAMGLFLEIKRGKEISPALFPAPTRVQREALTPLCCPGFSPDTADSVQDLQAAGIAVASLIYGLWALCHQTIIIIIIMMAMKLEISSLFPWSLSLVAIMLREYSQQWNVQGILIVL